ncbi:MAG: DUF262 domain-containing protein [Anaerolineales bacterium]
MTLKEEIDRTRAEIRTDSYSMSIGEWISLYERNELDIHPEFQRFYRWSEFQKSRLIESILLGIPIPQIFVAQREDGVWDVVDGVQRLSTIFEFVGLLQDNENNLLPPLVLEKTKYLPSLAGKKWDDPDDETNSFSTAERLIIKRSKIDVSIILKESDEMSKYELFQRLNTGGSPLSDQEVRNSILVMMNNDIYRWLRTLSQNDDFRECISLTDKALEEQYDMDLALRFVIFRTMDNNQLNNIGDVNEFLTDKMIELTSSNQINIEEETEAFQFTFDLLRNTLGSQSFHRYDLGKSKFLGGFLVSAFELVALGVGYNHRELAQQNINIEDITKGLWQNDEFINYSGSGVRASSRIPHTVPLGRQAFRP